MFNIKCLVLLALFVSNVSLASTYENKKNAVMIPFQHELDQRKIKNKTSPSALNAVGKLEFKRKKNKRDRVKLNCTANLIAPAANMGSDIILTAKHCVSDEILSYTWTSKTETKKVSRVAKVIYEDEFNDWALLKLTEAVLHDEIKPLIIDVSAMGNVEHIKAEDYMVAGFSVDWLGNYGRTMTYEDNPSYINFSTSEKSHIGKIGALTHQGDSGGAVIYESEDNNYLVGIMSFISGDSNLFKSKKGTFGNLSGYFLDFVKYEAFHLITSQYF